MKKIIPQVTQAPTPSGTYSTAVQVGNTVYLAGQIPLVPSTGEMVTGDMSMHVRQVFHNLQAVVQATGGTLDDIVKLTIYLTDLTHFPIINQMMAEFFSEPYPARTTVEVSALPKNALIELDGILVLADA